MSRPATTLLVAGATGAGAKVASVAGALVSEVTVFARPGRALSTAVWFVMMISSGERWLAATLQASAAGTPPVVVRR
jgi:hypothetical protein